MKIKEIEGKTKEFRYPQKVLTNLLCTMSMVIEEHITLKTCIFIEKF